MRVLTGRGKKVKGKKPQKVQKLVMLQSNNKYFGKDKAMFMLLLHFCHS